MADKKQDKIETVVNILLNLEGQDNLSTGLEKIQKRFKDVQNSIANSTMVLGNDFSRNMQDIIDSTTGMIEKMSSGGQILLGTFQDKQFADFAEAYRQSLSTLGGQLLELRNQARDIGFLSENDIIKAQKLTKLYEILVHEGQLFNKELAARGIEPNLESYIGFKRMIDKNSAMLKEYKQQFGSILEEDNQRTEKISLNLARVVHEYSSTVNAVVDFYSRIGKVAKGSIEAVQLWTIMLKKVALDMFSNLNQMDTEYHKLIYGVVSDSSDIMGRSYKLVSMTNVIMAKTGLEFNEISSAFKSVAEYGGIARDKLQETVTTIAEFSHITGVSTQAVAQFTTQLAKLGGEKGLKAANALLNASAEAMKRYGLSSVDLSTFTGTMDKATVNIMALSNNQDIASASVKSLGRSYLAVNGALKKTMGSMKELGKIFEDASSPLDALNSKFMVLYARTGALTEFIKGKASSGMYLMAMGFESIDKQVKNVDNALGRQILMNTFAGSTRAYLELRKALEHGGIEQYQKNMEEAADVQAQFTDATHNLAMIFRRLLLPVLTAINAVIRPFLPLLKFLLNILSAVVSVITWISDLLESVPGIGHILNFIFGVLLVASILRFHNVILKILTIIPKLTIGLIKWAAGMKHSAKTVATAGQELKKGIEKVISLEGGKWKIANPAQELNKHIIQPVSNATKTASGKIVSFVKDIPKKLKGITAPLAEIGGKIKEGISNAGSKIAEGFSGTVTKVKDFVLSLPEKFKGLTETFGKITKSLSGFGGKIVGGIKSLFSLGPASAVSSRGLSMMGSGGVFKGILAMTLVTGALIALFWAVDKFNMTPARLAALGFALISFAGAMIIMMKIMTAAGRAAISGAIYVGAFIFVVFLLGLTLKLMSSAFKTFGEGFKMIADAMKLLSEVSLVTIGAELIAFMGQMIIVGALSLFASVGISAISDELLDLAMTVSLINIKPLELLSDIIKSVSDIDPIGITMFVGSLQELTSELTNINASKLKNMKEASKQIISLSSAVLTLTPPPSETINKSLNSIVENILSNRKKYEEASELISNLKLSSEAGKPPTTTNLASKSSGAVSNTYSETKLKVELNDEIKKTAENIESNTNDIKNINDNISNFVNDINNKMSIESLLGIHKVRWL